ncbi:MAG TPA: circadian clock KaiB family protein [Verrucomicrobiae bacterium]
MKTKAKKVTAKRKQAKKKPPLNETATFEKLLKKATGVEHYTLRLYITGSTPRSSQAVKNIRSLCEEYLPGRYDLEVVDIYQQPLEAADEQVIAAPTLIKKMPAPMKRLVGDLSDRDKVVVGLNLKSKTQPDGKIKWVKV